MEPISRVSGSKRLEERPVRLADPIVQLVSARPEGISTRRRKQGQSQRREVTRRLLEADIAVPNGSEFAVGPLVQLLPFQTVDRADLGIGVPEFPRVVDHRVDVQAVFLGTASELAKFEN